MALSVVLSVIFSLVIGLTFGYFVAVKRQSRIYKVKKESLSSARGRNEKNQNLYEIDEGTSHHSCNEHCRALPNGKQQSEPRENNAENDFSRADILDRRKNVAYL